jgi:uroporphyrinogen decarboxylase
MDAVTLSRDFGGRISFFGGIDTQELLVHGSEEEIRDEVRRVREVLGPHLIISPSHEALLPNVPPTLLAAMAAAARGG